MIYLQTYKDMLPAAVTSVELMCWAITVVRLLVTNVAAVVVVGCESLDEGGTAAGAVGEGMEPASEAM